MNQLITAESRKVKLLAVKNKSKEIRPIMKDKINIEFSNPKDFIKNEDALNIIKQYKKYQHV